MKAHATKRAICLAALIVAFVPTAAAETLIIPGPQGSLEGEAIVPSQAKAAIVVIPGSGPIDRNGNGPTGLRTDTYRLLAEGLAKAGFATLRVDKRGFFGSSGAVADPEDVTIKAYAEDAADWLSSFSMRVGTKCAWLAGHSEGGLVALLAAADGAKACGLILLSTPGRPIGELMREQFRKNPANAPYLAELERIVSALEKGEMQDESTISPVLRPLFRPGLQRYMIQLFAYDPVELARHVALPALILQGDKDIQVTQDDAERLAAALPHAELAVLPSLTHMLKADVPGSPFATYQDPQLPLGNDVVPTIANFIEQVERK